MKVESLEWDSQFLGAPVSRIVAEGASRRELAEAVARLRAAGVRLAYLFADSPLAPADADALQARLVDRKVTYRMEADGLPSTHPWPAVTPYVPAMPQAELERLAIESGKYSRFHVDPRFPEDKFVALYVQWLRKSLTGEIADAVLVATDAGRPVGLVTMAQSGPAGKIGLVAVDEACRGRGLGRQLVEAARQWFASRQVSHAEVVTQQDNVAACRLYETCGFRVHAVQYVYHLWLATPPTSRPEA
ncbi:MAG: dTDP-4-amino-4,6-dideoxy-D-galactose acyltransferase [Ramlibacter sp.]|jgi:dTDP-4-amino-4,6-dideoxy-D-galactose acyltransferase|nr:dTDP-4-amino-4,6-dideoxy-D-galactose acyltransferase [Ramlibacter sp.]